MSILDKTVLIAPSTSTPSLGDAIVLKFPGRWQCKLDKY